MKNNNVALGSMLFLLAFGLVLSACDLSPQPDGGTGSKPSRLSDNAGYDEAIAKLDAIIAYCDANPNAANNAVKVSATGYKASISNFGGSLWSSYSSSVITAINLYIDQLQPVNNNGNGNNSDNNNGSDNSSKPSRLSDNASYNDAAAKLDAIIAYCDANPNAANNAIKVSATGYKASISNFGGSLWSSYSSSVITAINLYIDQLQPVNNNGNDNNGNGNNNDNNIDNDNSSKPSRLSDNASYNDAAAKLDAIIAYCDANPNAANNAVKISAAGYKASISNFGGSLWSSYSSSVITAINLYIDQLQPVNDSGNDNNGNGNDNNGNSTGIVDSRLLEVWYYGRIIWGAYFPNGTTAEGLVTFTRQFSTWYDFTVAGGELYVNGAIVTSGSFMIQPSDWVIVLAPGSGGWMPVSNAIVAGLFVKWAGTLSEGGITGVTLAQDLVDLGIITDFSNWNAFIQAGGKLFVNGYEVTVGTTPIQPNDPIRLLKPGISYGNSGAHYPFDPETGKILLFEGPFEGFPPGFAQMVLPFITTSTVHPSFSWSQLTAEGGELYVNGAIVTSGSFMIQPGDWVKVLIPVSALVTPSPFFDVGPVYADSHLVSR